MFSLLYYPYYDVLSLKFPYYYVSSLILSLSWYLSYIITIMVSYYIITHDIPHIISIPLKTFILLYLSYIIPLNGIPSLL